MTTTTTARKSDEQLVRLRETGVSVVEAHLFQGRSLRRIISMATSHLHIQGKVDPEIPFFLEHTEWVKPYVAGFYAHKYEDRMITREEAKERLEELLAYELASTNDRLDGQEGSEE